MIHKFRLFCDKEDVICILNLSARISDRRNEMYIKSMVIDGFKSYGTRTTIDGFDEQFNAITGLNGSGKSNILDSICFLLGK